MDAKGLGFTELTYSTAAGLGTRQADYILVERDGKKYAEPISKPRDSIDSWWPLTDFACQECGVYGLVHTIRSGGYKCAWCGETCILVPSTILHVR